MNKDVLKKINILYVEDEDEVRSLTTNVLSKFVNSLVEAINGKEGLELFKKHNGENSPLNESFDLVITDINMPKMDGLEMLRGINEIDHAIPSIITTAHNDADFLKKAINQRVRGYVSKPLNLHDLMDSIILAVEPKFLKDQLISANKNLEEQVEEKTLELRSIIDSQENLILVMDNNETSSVNKTLLDYFGAKDLGDFKEKFRCMSSLFLNEEDYFYVKDPNNWVEEIGTFDDIKRVVKMKNVRDEIKIFQVSITSFFFNTKHYVVSFTDITDLKNYTHEMQYQATHDNLTKLYNRQKLNDELNKEVLREKRYEHGFSLIMFDIDDFKMVNDTYGHDIGDVVLQNISKITMDSIRSTDYAARWGGEEFMILLPETNLENTNKIAQTIREEIEIFDFDGVDGHITVSIGVAVFDKEKEDKESILKHVDIALYDAKNNGKNQVINYKLENNEK